MPSGSLNGRSLQLLTWLVTLAVVVVALYVWWPATKSLTSYSLFPIFGLIAFSLMWTHYVAGAAREYFRLPPETLKLHFQWTSYIVLFCILAHPTILDTQLYLDGFGLPPGSLFAVYTESVQRLALLAGVTALTCFLFFELHRFFKDRSWWKYVEWANIGAMALILVHGFTLGGALRHPWFQVVWVFYGVTFVLAVAYSGYSKRRSNHGRTTIV